MLASRHRFPSRGSAAARSAVGAEGPMLTPLPAERIGRFRGSGAPVQDLVGTGLRELFVGMLDSPTAVRLGDNSSRPRYFGTVLPQPQVWQSPAEVNSDDQLRSSVKNAGNAPEMMNKRAGEAGGPPRVASSLPRRSI